MASLKLITNRHFHKKYLFSLYSHLYKKKSYNQCAKFHRSSLLCVTGIELRMPSLSPTMTDGTIVKWVIQEGGNISPGDVVCDIQTDKAIVSFEVEEEGTMAKILVPENTPNVKVGTLIALMVAPGEDWKSVEIPKVDTPPQTSTTTSSDKSEIVKEQTKPSELSKGFFGPVVRNLLDRYGINPSQIKSTGTRGVLLKEDVLKYIEEQKVQPVDVKVKDEKSKKDKVATSTKTTSNPYFDIELSNMRTVIAKRLTDSKRNIPHAYMAAECNIDQILNLRSQMDPEKRPSVNDFLIKAVASSLSEHSSVNVQWTNNGPVQQPTVDVSVAVDTGTGLITPIVKNASTLGLNSISETMKGLVAKAKAGKLQPNEFIGGSFTISNLGMFGIKEFTAIINPPQCAILAVGGGQKNIDINKQVITTINITLCYDVRAIDDTQAAKFLTTLKLKLEQPILMA